METTTPDIPTRIKTVIVESLQLEMAPADVSDDTLLFSSALADGLDLDSLAALEIVIGLSNEFAIELDEVPREAFQSVATLGIRRGAIARRRRFMTLYRDVVFDDVLGTGLSLGADRPAIIDGDGTMSYGDLASEVERRASEFERCDYRPGHRMLLHCEPAAGAIVTLLAALAVGMTVAVVSSRLGTAAIATRWKAARPDLACDAAATRMSAGRVGPPREPVCAVVFWTSGTSGEPHPVVLSLEAVVWNARANARALRIVPSDRAFVVLDVAYCYALVHQILTHIIAGGSVSFAAQPLWQAGTVEQLERDGATTIALVPALLPALTSANSVGRALRSMRCVTVGVGAAAPADLLAAAAENARGDIFVTYGLAEAGPRVATRRLTGATSADPGNVGTPLDGVTVWLEGDELCVATPSARIGTLTDGRYQSESPLIRTGDRGRSPPMGRSGSVGVSGG